MNAPVVFNFDSASVRVVVRDGNEPWFVAGDVCDALELGNPRTSLALLDDDEKGVHSVDTLGGAQEVTIISEPGLYSLVLRSRKPEAKRFKRWVTHEVLPSIRKTGAYGQPPADFLNDPAAMRGLLLGYTEKVLALQHEVGELKPKAVALDRFMTGSDGSFCLTDAAKALQVAPRLFIAKLQEMGWIHRRPMGTGWLAYQERIAMGVLEHKVTTGERPDRTEWASTQVRVTAKGMARLSKVFGEAVAA